MLAHQSYFQFSIPPMGSLPIYLVWLSRAYRVCHSPNGLLSSMDAWLFPARLGWRSLQSSSSLEIFSNCSVWLTNSLELDGF